MPTEIADNLNKAKIPVRSVSVGNMHTRKGEIKRGWNRDLIIQVARDRTYLGDVINGKSKKLSYKSKKIILTKKENQIIVHGKHEPLIDEETFNIVQDLIDSRMHTKIYKYDFLLKGLLECEECGKKISVLSLKQKNGKVIQYTRCNTYASMTKSKLCTPHSNNCEKLTEKILSTIKTRLQEYQKEEKYFLLAKDIKDKTLYKKNLIQNQIDTMTGKIEKENIKIDQLYNDKLNGIIGTEDFERMYKSILDKKDEMKKLINDLKLQKEDTMKEIDLKKLVKDFVDGKEITRELLVSLIDKITISENKEIKIYYKFSLLNNKYEDNIINFETAIS